MIDPRSLLIAALIIAAIIALGWWLLIETEGVYLGRRVVVWLYDLYAGRYDGIKQFSKQYDHQYLAQPIMEQIAPLQTPLILDVATGTGRLPLALLRHRQFHGRVIGADLSRKMLARAAAKIDDPRVTLIWTPAEHLPFPDDTFDVVTCLEAVEFMIHREAVLRELVRVLRPDGLHADHQPHQRPLDARQNVEQQAVTGASGSARSAQSHHRLLAGRLQPRLGTQARRSRCPP